VTPRPQLSIIIINYRSADFTRKCVQTIREDAGTVALETIVIDNDSHDGCGAILQSEFPEVHFIQSEKNLGFAGANNLGAARSAGSFLLFLNPDTEVQGQAIQNLLSALESDPDVAMVGARLLNSDRSVQTTSITAFPSILNQTFGAESLHRRFPKLKLWGMRPLFEPHQQPVAVDAISGACMMIRREAFIAVGGFTADYFMYAEDLDLCLKVRQSGHEVCYVPNAVVVHHGGKSSSSRSESNYAAIMIRESMVCFMTRHRGEAYATAFRAVTAINALSRLMVLSLLFAVSLATRRQQKVGNQIAKWMSIFKWSVGLQSWVGRETASQRSTTAMSRVTQAQ